MAFKHAIDPTFCDKCDGSGTALRNPAYCAIMKADAVRHFPVSESKPRQIGILAYPGIELLDAIGPLEVFAAANRLVGEPSPRSPGAYESEIGADRLGAIDGSSGVGLIATRSIASSAPVELDTLLVAG